MPSAAGARHTPTGSTTSGTDEDLAALVRERAPELVPLYEAYPEAIQRVDAARYVILREFGGVYADLDLVCLRPIDALLDAEVVLPRTTPFGVSNQFMLSVKGHSLFRHTVASLPRAYAKWGRVMAATPTDPHDGRPAVPDWTAARARNERGHANPYAGGARAR